ncbi:hypothetical protein ACE38W_14840 [Chitinophaga sp. Hz27]|uniref:hypothetical protein n=1 Tax=Chitinophaga sp. Hz27 TaxID=3347169 RepID=UPI0035D6995A
MVQIDVKEIVDCVVICNLYTPGRVVKILLNRQDYELLMQDGFFIRDSKEKDSADVLNTTKEYK